MSLLAMEAPNVAGAPRPCAGGFQSSSVGKDASHGRVRARTRSPGTRGCGLGSACFRGVTKPTDFNRFFDPFILCGILLRIAKSRGGQRSRPEQRVLRSPPLHAPWARTDEAGAASGRLPTPPGNYSSFLMEDGGGGSAEARGAVLEEEEEDGVKRGTREEAAAWVP